MKFINTEINVGAEKPFELLHFSDIHLTYADERDDARKIELAKGRSEHFPGSQENLDAVVAEARRTGALPVSTGDLCDFVSCANLDAVKKFSDENDYFFAPGNHEFSLYVGEAWEDAAYRAQSFDRVQAAHKNPLMFATRIVNGVKLIAISNGYYLIEQPQLDALKAECADGMPVILMMHVPLYTRAMSVEMMQRKNNLCAYVMGAPDELVDTYEEYRARQQRADAVTKEACEFITSCPSIRAVLAGHVHGEHYEDPVTDTLTQYIVGTCTARRITVK